MTRYGKIAVADLFLAGALFGLGVTMLTMDGPPIIGTLNLGLSVLMGGLGALNVTLAEKQARIDELKRQVER